MKKKLLAALLSAIVVMGSTAGCGQKGTQSGGGSTGASAGGNGKTIKIGLMVPLTGTGVQAGQEVKALAEIFADIINNDHPDLNLPFAKGEGLPNLGGAKVEFVTGDLSSPDIAMSEAERLITQQNVIGLCGNFASASTKTAMVPAEKYHRIVLSEGTSNTLTQAGYQYYGRAFPGDNDFVKDTFDYLDQLNKTKNAGIKTVALVSEDSEFGTYIAGLERTEIPKHGFKQVEDIYYSASATNVTSEVLRLKNANPDVVIMSSYAADALLFMSTYKEMNYFPKMLFGQRGGFMTSDFLKNLGSDSDYVMTTARWNTDINNEASKTVAKLFYDKMGFPLSGDVLNSAWDGVLLAAIANQAGSTDADAMRKVMSEGIKIDKAEDPFALEGYKFDESGQNVYGKAIILQYMNKSLKTIYPQAASTAEAAYPAKGWNER